jgi:hypothetical protein
MYGFNSKSILSFVNQVVDVWFQYINSKSILSFVNQVVDLWFQYQSISIEKMLVREDAGVGVCGLVGVTVLSILSKQN